MAGTVPGLPDRVRRVPAVVAHPDDESFGLGGLPALLSDVGVPTAVLCFTHGEASTRHGRRGDLHTLRAGELACTARELGVERVELAGHPDGGLADVPRHRLASETARLIGEGRPSHLLVEGVTGTTNWQVRQVPLRVVRRWRGAAADGVLTCGVGDRLCVFPDGRR
ncbi:hypothetical protein SLUN_29920 [Streptomyces lunaelactis]|uniref:PIG-L family deacetylase n=1 Tax=Streptomyces lunaelactis TaxID=1535768 RepID=A0A2R4T9J3_9ACTN|nr:PIG-L family deacetylase [Streptomyces lunaelactis]AVZ75800.1 hypothetical protein SLUN_29920 [Streptomyces lunaelactis]NUK84708.1 PIG-L family deacetylase [Streptomyces lunaelactis]